MPVPLQCSTREGAGIGRQLESSHRLRCVEPLQRRCLMSSWFQPAQYEAAQDGQRNDRWCEEILTQWQGHGARTTAEPE